MTVEVYACYVRMDRETGGPMDGRQAIRSRPRASRFGDEMRLVWGTAFKASFAMVEGVKDEHRFIVL